MKKIILLYISISAFTYVKAQDTDGHKIYGAVADSLGHKPLDKITLSLSGAGNSRNLTTEPNGKFEFDGLRNGSYSLDIHAIGFKPLEVTIKLKADTNLGTISLQPDAKNLKEVTIVSTRPLIQQKPGKLIYDMQADPESKAKSLLDMLHKIPFITVDAQDNVSLKGSTNFKVFINGKPSAMMDNNLTAVLRTMPAASIQRIEVITNPPAKYDAEGIGGIINIITVKNVDNGYRGNLNTSEQFPNGGPNAGGGFTMKQGKFGINVYAGAGIYNNHQTNFSNTQQSFGNNATLLDQNGYTHNNSRNGYIGTELSYEIDSLHLLSGSISYNGYHNDGSSYQLSRLTGAGGFLQAYDISNENNGHGNGGDASVNYQVGFKTDKNRLLTFSYRYAGYRNNAFSNLLLSNEVAYPVPDYQQPNSSTISEHTFQTDLVYPVKKLMIEGGVKAILRSDNSDYQYLQLNSNTHLYDAIDSLSNQFYYTQNVFSIYNSYQFSLGKWNVNAGVRAEETTVNAHFLSKETAINPNYLNVVPSLSINRSLGTGGLGISFNQRIQRPGINRLNPFIDKSNPNFIVTGNPKLQPNTINQAQLSYSTGNSGKISVFVATDYIFVHNMGLPVTTFDPVTQVTTVTYQNTGKGEGIDLIGNLNYNVTHYYSISLNTNSTRFLLSGMSGNSIVYLHRWMTMEELNNTLRLNKGWSFNASFRYNSASPISIQGYTNAYFNTNIGMNKEIVKGKLYFALSANNPFTKFRNIVNTTNGPDFLETNINQTYYRSVRVSLNYNFGRLNGDVKKSRKGIDNNDLNNRSGL
ncbi:MAG TPA: outer membrane beta-barrel family protein [Mucilaginibacter sp.]|nr:outer membrane beta-barrel family protein [Mucilaginibacter sp.]